MLGISVQKAPSARSCNYLSGKPEKPCEGSVKPQSRFKKLFKRSDTKKMVSPNVPETADLNFLKQTPTQTTVTINRGFSFEDLTSLLIHSFSLKRLQISKSEKSNPSVNCKIPGKTSDSELNEPKDEKMMACLENLDPERVAIAPKQGNHSNVPKDDINLGTSLVLTSPCYPDKSSSIVTRSLVNPSRIAYFQGLHKLKSCEHRRLREILLLHQTITKAHHILITEGLQPESVQERSNPRFTRPTSPSSYLPLFTTAAPRCIKRPIRSSLPPPPYRPYDEEDVPLGLLQLKCKRPI